MRFSRQSLHYAELLVVLLGFIAMSTGALYIYFSTDGLLGAYILATLLFVAFSVLYVLRIDAAARGGFYSNALHALFLLFAVLFVAYYGIAPEVSGHLLQSALGLFDNSGFYFILFLPAFFLAFFGVYFACRKGRNARLLGCTLMAGLLALLLFYYFSGYIFTEYKIDDEVYLSYTAVQSILHGQDPYTASVFNSLFSNATTVGVSVTLNNNIVSVMDYPSLYFLTFLPFYFIGPPTLAGLLGYDLKVETVVLLFILLLTVAYLSGRKNLTPNFAMLFVLAILMRFIASIAAYLMFAVLLLAYFKIDRKYSFILLGVCASMQEELWLPVIFLLAYSLNNQGIGAGLRNAVGTLAVFLVFNGYFIAMNPGAYLYSVITPLNQVLIPNPTSPIGYFIATGVGTTLGGLYTLLFGLATMALVLVLLRTNRKELIPIFSIIPLFFMSRGLDTYYFSFIFVFLFVLAAKEKFAGIGKIGRLMKERPVLLCAPMALIVVTAAALIYVSHMQYADRFGVSAYESNFTINNATNSSSYELHIRYGSLNNDTVYLIPVELDTGGMNFRGIINESVIPGAKAQCSEDICKVNVNRMVLNGTGRYDTLVTLAWPNKTKRISDVASLIYNAQDVYITAAVH